MALALGSRPEEALDLIGYASGWTNKVRAGWWEPDHEEAVVQLFQAC